MGRVIALGLDPWGGSSPVVLTHVVDYHPWFSPMWCIVTLGFDSWCGPERRAGRAVWNGFAFAASAAGERVLLAVSWT